MEKSPAVKSWDDLRKLARKLENELDIKLSSYGRLIDTLDIEASEKEIEQLLQQLQQTNLEMQSLLQDMGSDVVSHTLTRHKNILQELNQEFRRISSTAKANSQRAQLLQSFSHHADRKGQRNSESEQSRLSEQESIYRATGQIDMVINQAQSALGALTSQRGVFGDIGVKINSVSSRLPSVNHILMAIKRKKSKDTLILSAVISICTILLFLYWISK